MRTFGDNSLLEKNPTAEPISESGISWSVDSEVIIEPNDQA